MKANFDDAEIDELESQLQALTQQPSQEPEILWGMRQVMYRRI